jgi:hypothetical protein
MKTFNPTAFVACFLMASACELAYSQQVTERDGKPFTQLKLNALQAHETKQREVKVKSGMLVRPRAATQPVLSLQLADLRTYPFGELQTTSSNAEVDLDYRGKFSALPVHYKGTGFLMVEGADAGGTRITQKSNVFDVEIDQVPPSVQFVRPIEDAGGANTLVVSFKDENLPTSFKRELFKVTLPNGQKDFRLDPNGADYPVMNNEVKIPLEQSYSGVLLVVVEKLSDSFGNTMSQYSTTVGATGQRVLGPAVDFPPNVVPQPAGRHSDTNDIRPSSRVVTRVVKLYYYRNADRVAEIINRRTQQFNLSQATAKRNIAGEYAQKAENATVERRDSERRAEQAARETRAEEAELQRLQMEAEEARTVRNRLTGVPEDSVVVADGTGGLGIVTKEAFVGSGNPSTDLTTVAEFKTQLGKVITDFENQKQKVENLKKAEFEANNQARRNEDLETRLIRSQFLKEVEAAETDPKTYAPADINSVDPVMQTSVSVIGEGVLQLRGPIAGINTIRRMIHEIDTPVGQVKVDLETVQINGEKGKELEETVQHVEGYINVGRFLTNQSLVLLSRSVYEVASEVAQEYGEPWQRDQISRDMRYLYGFFGQDFVDTLHRMDSEFLHTENQILSIHSMDAISRNRALLLIGLAKNSVRQRILERFQEYVSCTLPKLEYDYRTINKTIPCQYLPDCHEKCKEKTWNFLHPQQKCERVYYTPEIAATDAAQNYKFLNFYNFFAQGVWHDGSLNPVQREFIRLAQIFKSQLIAEIELKQRVIERGLMDQKLSEDRLTDQQQLLDTRKDAVVKKNLLLAKNTKATEEVAGTVVQVISNVVALRQEISQYRDQYQTLLSIVTSLTEEEKKGQNSLLQQSVQEVFRISQEIEPKLMRSRVSLESLGRIVKILHEGELAKLLMSLRDGKTLIEAEEIFFDEYSKKRQDTERFFNGKISEEGRKVIHGEVARLNEEVQHFITTIEETNRYVTNKYDEVLQSLEVFQTDWKPTFRLLQELEPFIPKQAIDWQCRHRLASDALREMVAAQITLKATQDFLDKNRLSLPQIKLLDHLIDEHEEKSMNLLEGKRSHISAIDNFLKRMTFALEDDFQVQFYDSALACIRSAGRDKRVTLSQIERTTALGNNRELMKVLPQASMEFDLPNRKLRITEAMQGAKALVDDYGALLNDPTFLAAFQMMGGGAPAESVRKVIPGLNSDPNQNFHALPAAQSGDRLGASLQGLVPDPSIYSIETGTGWEVKPVIQPDGDSLVYDLNYLYHTELREPVRADEKHLGRIKRHLIHTQVQTSSFELREVGRYQVALKVSRTGRGVPMLENTPVVGALFRPAPSEESSIQQNILLAKSVIYPTLYDMMGLAWAQHVAELGYDDIRNSGHVARGRQNIIRQHVFDESSRNVDDFLQIKKGAENHRPDLYRDRTVPSPYHPNGYVHPKVHDDQDPTRRGFRLPEQRPEAFRSGAAGGMQAEEFDERFRLPIPRDGTQYNQQPVQQPMQFVPNTTYGSPENVPNGAFAPGEPVELTRPQPIPNDQSSFRAPPAPQQLPATQNRQVPTGAAIEPAATLQLDPLSRREARQGLPPSSQVIPSSYQQPTANKYPGIQQPAKPQVQPATINQPKPNSRQPRVFQAMDLAPPPQAPRR